MLVVDDDEDLRRTVTMVLAEEGYRVLEAANGAEALSRLHDGPLPDVILLDLMMPVMNGEQFRRAQQADPLLARVPVVVMTAAGSRAVEQMGALGPMRVLHKPVGLEPLLETVDEVASGHGRDGRAM
ncbi:response regulator [Polyangium sp. y55x31]|uniref:response regulator n=1 Tax=Polyangium sp. y55x31 TaxID=3042688 RepID=UPI0024821681|nr:response regulator [Polyangium sp. y55x31]MDI1479138.1 response regulator [Polyangium sp. y55x31]